MKRIYVDTASLLGLRTSSYRYGDMLLLINTKTKETFRWFDNNDHHSEATDFMNRADSIEDLMLIDDSLNNRSPSLREFLLRCSTSN